MKTRFLSIITASVIALGAFSAPVQQALCSQSVVADAAVSVLSPTASKKSGTYYSTGSMKVSLTAEKTAKIYYSINGGNYKLYSAPITITKNTTLRTYSVKNGTRSSYKTYTYKLSPKVAISVAAGTYDSPQTVKLTSKVTGVKLYYTLDGSKPTKSSSVYTSAGISINSSCKLRILATAPSWTSRYITKSYTINVPELDVTPSVSSSELSILDDYTSKWGYSTLSAAQKKGYAALFEAASKHADTADMKGFGLTVDDVEKMYWAFDYDNPQFFWNDNGYSYGYTSRGELVDVSIIYGRTAAEAAKIQGELDAAADKILAEALKYDSTMDRVKVLHDSIINMTSYSTSGPAYKSEADGPLVHGTGLCEGYSKAFMYLCQSIGIECICVSGKSSGYGHMWNMVKVDGTWYHMDVTWDDPISSKPILRYDYFCLSEKDMLADDHKLDTPFPLPSAPTTYKF